MRVPGLAHSAAQTRVSAFVSSALDPTTPRDSSDTWVRFAGGGVRVAGRSTMAVKQPFAPWSFPPPAKWSHPDAARLDDGEVTCPIVTRHYQVGEPLSDFAWARHEHAQQDNPARTWQHRCSGQLAEIFVKSEQNALLAGGPRPDRSCPAPLSSPKRRRARLPRER